MIFHTYYYTEKGDGKTTNKLLVSNVDANQMYVNNSDENNVEAVRNKIKMFSFISRFQRFKSNYFR